MHSPSTGFSRLTRARRRRRAGSCGRARARRPSRPARCCAGRSPAPVLLQRPLREDAVAVREDPRVAERERAAPGVVRLRLLRDHGVRLGEGLEARPRVAQLAVEVELEQLGGARVAGADVERAPELAPRSPPFTSWIRATCQSASSSVPQSATTSSVSPRLAGAERAEGEPAVHVLDLEELGRRHLRDVVPLDLQRAHVVGLELEA